MNNRTTPKEFNAEMLLKYRGNNNLHRQQRTLSSIKIKTFYDDTGEQLIVEHTLFDGTELLFNLTTSSVYVKKEGRYQFPLVEDEETEERNYCNFELFKIDNVLLFDGFIAYEKVFNENFKYHEEFTAIIIVENNEELIEIWSKPPKIMQLGLKTIEKED